VVGVPRSPCHPGCRSWAELPWPQPRVGSPHRPVCPQPSAGTKPLLGCHHGGGQEGPCRAGQRGRTPPRPVPTLLGMQPRGRGAFWAARTRWGLTPSFPPPAPPRPSPQGCSHPTLHLPAWICLDPGPCIPIIILGIINPR